MINPKFTAIELTTEQWLPVVDYEGLYSVSSLGRIRRDKPAKGAIVGSFLKLRYNKRTRYWQVNLRKNLRMKTQRIHVLVARAFLGPAPDGHEINHKDSNGRQNVAIRKLNNRATNLEYVTPEQNAVHARENKLPQSGQRHWMKRFPNKPRFGRMSSS